LENNTTIPLDRLKELLDARILTNLCPPDFHIDHVICSELLSDILAYARNVENTALITALTNTQVLRTAEMVDIKCIVFARNKPIHQSIIDIADEIGIVLVSCPLSIFHAAGRIYRELKPEGTWK